MASTLDPIKRKPSRKLFGTCDIESQNWIDFVVIGCFDDRGFFEFGYDNNGIEAFFQHIFDEREDEYFDTQTKYQCNTYFGHFAGKFDFLFLLDYVVKSNKYHFDSAIPRGSSILCFKIKYGDRTVQFWDSSALLQFSLRKLTSSFQVKSLKGETDYNFIRHSYDNEDYSLELFKKDDFIVYYEDEPVDELPLNYDKKKVGYELKDDHLYLEADKITRHHIYERWELIAYLKNDCEGLHQVLERFYSWPLIEKAGSAMTVASQAQKILRTYLVSPIKGLEKDEDEFARKSYFGGRTEIFKPCYKDETGAKTLYCYDVNSLYPSVMRRFDFPTSVSGRSTTFDPDSLAIWHCKVRVPKMHIPPLPVKHGGKLIFPVGVFEGHWTTHELNMAMKYGTEIIQVYDGMLFNNGGKIFSEFITDLYKIRTDNPTDKDHPDFKPDNIVNNILAKLIMNSSYGRFGISDEKEMIGWEEGEDNERPFHEVTMENGKTFMMVNKTVELRGFSNVAIASYVTSYARIEMFEYYQKCGETLYYTDTDSIYTTKRFKDSFVLGGVKCEESTSEGVFLLPKTYITDNKLKMKGFEKKTLKFNFDDFVNALQGDLMAMKYTVWTIIKV